jgi:hypothetical protein
VGPECQSLGPTAPRPRRLPSDSGRCSLALACAHDIAAAISPPTVSPPPCRRRPPPLAAIKGAHPPPSSTLSSSSAYCPPTAPPFLPSLSHRGQPAPASLRPIQPRHEHRAVRYNLPAPRAVDHHPRTSPPPPFPSDQPHLTVELILPVSFFLPAAPKRVHHPTVLLPGTSPLHLVVDRRWNSAGPPPVPPWPSALPCLR